MINSIMWQVAWTPTWPLAVTSCPPASRQSCASFRSRIQPMTSWNWSTRPICARSSRPRWPSMPSGAPTQMCTSWPRPWSKSTPRCRRSSRATALATICLRHVSSPAGVCLWCAIIWPRYRVTRPRSRCCRYGPMRRVEFSRTDWWIRRRSGSSPPFCRLCFKTSGARQGSCKNLATSII